MGRNKHCRGHVEAGAAHWHPNGPNGEGIDSRYTALIAKSVEMVLSQ